MDLDEEHAPWGTESVGLLGVLARQSGVAAVIRVTWNEPGHIKKAYDVGAVGVIVPQVDTPDEARSAVRYARYPPLGERGIAPWFAVPLGITTPDVIRHANDETVLVLQMESVEAYERIDETLAVENFDVILAGPLDLSASLGVPGQLHHPKVERIMLDLVDRAKGTGEGAGDHLGRSRALPALDPGRLSDDERRQRPQSRPARLGAPFR